MFSTNSFTQVVPTPKLADEATEITTDVERHLTSPPLNDSNLSSEVFEEEKLHIMPKNKIVPVNGETFIVPKTNI